MSVMIRLLAALALTGILAGVAWHSIEEIHYLKRFFPQEFSVREACYAAWIEVAKVVILALPIGLTVLILAGWRFPRK